ncbi:hypothetical protein J2W14_003219 [Pseudarthrobacter oxydans]|uniref:hypothetical protein n=1 Tax=Pseudarthrobacter oxydans TaxID=1671 RepID=UPI002782FFD1|nr:hypothetical protein [Pseudarthrobacter oxydans]MDP9983796.1 hypothetical protein [Pseudarthrobacter oxydans]
MTFEERRTNGRASTDLSDLARAAAFGAVATLLVDMDAEVKGSVGDDGLLSLDTDTGQDAIEVIALRALGSGARVLAVRRSDMPGGDRDRGETPVSGTLEAPRSGCPDRSGLGLARVAS